MDVLIETLQFANLEEQVKMYKSLPAVRTYFDTHPLSWNVNTGTLLSLIEKENTEVLNFIATKVPIIGRIVDDRGHLISYMLQHGSTEAELSELTLPPIQTVRSFTYKGYTVFVTDTSVKVTKTHPFVPKISMKNCDITVLTAT